MTVVHRFVKSRGNYMQKNFAYGEISLSSAFLLDNSCGGGSPLSSGCSFSSPRSCGAQLFFMQMALGAKSFSQKKSALLFNIVPTTVGQPSAV